MGSANRCVVAWVLALSVCVGWASGQDWPQWRGMNRAGKVTGFKAPQAWPKEFTQKWKVKVGTGDATPALVGDKLYVFGRQGDEEVTLCLNADDGKTVWTDKYAAKAVTGPAMRHPGPRSSPAVAEGKVVTFGVAGDLSCLDANTGKVVWRKESSGKVPTFFTAMSPIIVDGMAIAQTGGQGEGAIVAFDLNSGAEKWRWAEESPEYSSPALVEVDGSKQIVAMTSKNIVSVSATDGKLLWKLPFAPAQRAYNAATPIVDGSTVIYTGAGRGTHAVKIEKQGDSFAAKEVWGNPDQAPQYTTPVLQDGKLFGMSNRGMLYCIDAKTGKTAWEDKSPLDRGGFGSLVGAGEIIFALPSSGELIAYKAIDKQYEEVARVKVSDSPVYAHPVIAGNRVYIRDADSVTLYTL